MIPIHIYASIIPAGVTVARPQPSDILFSNWAGTISKSMACMAVGEAPLEIEPEFDENANLPELGIVAGIATKELFVISHISDVCDFTQGHRQIESWASAFIGECPEILRENMPAILVDFLTQSAKACDPYDPEKKMVHPIVALTMWKEETSRDFESGIDELETIHYCGLGHTALDKSI